MSRVVFGKRPVAEALRHSGAQVQGLWLEQRRSEAFAEILAAARQAGIEPTWASREDLERLCGVAHHQGAAVRLRDFDYSSVKDFLARRPSGPRLVVMLDGVTDPQNFGACLRAAGAFGVDLVVIHRHHSCPVNATVAKVSAGGTEAVPVAREGNLAQALSALKTGGFWAYGLDHEAAETLAERDLTGDLVLVLGSEGEGMRRLVRENCDGLARIPADGPISSLNVAQACAVGLYEVMRQRAARRGN
jgi:23S rRNA (guanosine2251-2'-O)-methyltransferase